MTFAQAEEFAQIYGDRLPTNAEMIEFLITDYQFTSVFSTFQRVPTRALNGGAKNLVVVGATTEDYNIRIG